MDDNQNLKFDLQKESIENADLYNPKLDLPSYSFPKTEFIISKDFKDILYQQQSNQESLDLLIGKGNQIYYQDLSFTPNILIAGTIGTGKTQFIYNQIISWLYTKHPAELKFILCGSKSIDFNSFSRLERFYLASNKTQSYVINPSNSLDIFNSIAFECENRLSLFALANVKNIKNYNDKFKAKKLLSTNGHHFLPYIVVFIDDLFNFLTNNEILHQLTNITQRNLYIGITIIAATSQINSPKISGQLKSNFNFRIAFKLMSCSDSRKILDKEGAEHLINPGELLFFLNGRLTCAQQPYVSDDEIAKIINCVSLQRGFSTCYLLAEDTKKNLIELDSTDRDPSFEEAAKLVVMHQQGSTSLIQRKLKLGYNRVGRIMDQLEAAGIVGPFEGSKSREVLLPDDHALEQFLDKINKHSN